MKSGRNFRQYLQGVGNRLKKNGRKYGVEWQPVALENGARVKSFFRLKGRNGIIRILARKGSRRLDAGIVDLTNIQRSFFKVVINFDTSIIELKPLIVSY